MQQAQTFLLNINSQLKFSKNILLQNPVILNSFMELCVKLQIPDTAVQVHLMTREHFDHQPLQTNKQDADQATKNTSI